MVSKGKALEGHQPDPTKAGEGSALKSGKEVPFSFKFCKNSTIYKHRACYNSSLGTLLTFVECSIHGHRQLHNIIDSLGIFHLFCGQALQLLLHQKTEDLVRVLRAAAVSLKNIRRTDVTPEWQKKIICCNNDVT